MKLIKIEFDYSKLIGLMKEKGYTQEKLAKEIGISVVSLRSKLFGIRYFTAIEIYRISKILGCDENIEIYFFAAKVKKKLNKN